MQIDFEHLKSSGITGKLDTVEVSFILGVGNIMNCKRNVASMEYIKNCMLKTKDMGGRNLQSVQCYVMSRFCQSLFNTMSWFCHGLMNMLKSFVLQFS